MGQLSMSDDRSVEVLEEDSEGEGEGEDVLNSSHLQSGQRVAPQSVLDNVVFFVLAQF